jgi:O-acetyl-ADP-ribose deacetylase
MILAELPFPSGRMFQVVRGDLLEEPVDAIVNAANGQLAHGGGVAGIISRAAGPALQAECDRIVRERGPLRAGSAVASGAGALAFKGVIHAVGPRQGEGAEEEKLVSALQAAFRCADEAGWAAVSFPAVSSGVFAVPLPVCARAYDAAVRGWFEKRRATSLRLIRLCLREQAVIEAVLSELGLRP